MATARPDPDELLARVRAEEHRASRGKLKIFFGAAPGVGKTYAMLLAAREAASETYMRFMRTSASGSDAVSEDRESPAQREEADSDSDEDNIHHGLIFHVGQV